MIVTLIFRSPIWARALAIYKEPRFGVEYNDITQGKPNGPKSNKRSDSADNGSDR
ncbi:MAG: hypothetical protein PXY39_13015 [archaeon]|nr:hypothetical protein [archaeon]